MKSIAYWGRDDSNVFPEAVSCIILRKNHYIFLTTVDEERFTLKQNAC